MIVRCMLAFSLAWLLVVFLNYSHGRIVTDTGLADAETEEVGDAVNAGGGGGGIPEGNQNDKEPPPPPEPYDVEDVEAAKVVEPPHDPDGPGEMGRAVKIDNPDPEVKKKIDEGWRNNAFNGYVSDLISLQRSLPDHR